MWWYWRISSIYSNYQSVLLIVLIVLDNCKFAQHNNNNILLLCLTSPLEALMKVLENSKERGENKLEILISCSPNHSCFYNCIETRKMFSIYNYIIYWILYILYYTLYIIYYILYNIYHILYIIWTGHPSFNKVFVRSCLYIFLVLTCWQLWWNCRQVGQSQTRKP